MIFLQRRYSVTAGNWIRKPIHLCRYDLSNEFSLLAQAKSSLKFLRSPASHDGFTTIAVSRQLGRRIKTRCRLAAMENCNDIQKAGDFLSGNSDFKHYFDDPGPDLRRRRQSQLHRKRQSIQRPTEKPALGGRRSRVDSDEDGRPGSRAAADDISRGHIAILISRFITVAIPPSRRRGALPFPSEPHLDRSTYEVDFFAIFRRFPLYFTAFFVAIFRRCSSPFSVDLPRSWLNVTAILVLDLAVVFPCVCRARR
ncbi:hypothetical protein TIFTF001_028332 [Ficus carica]|uniref:Uncharacterized protein n=1 Tax=Ficus carica TaxID=3494 RepID=A0AA88DQW9_FICCA|nr:hypothetical protein TIFTF001_028332 [Ficus carica]